MPSYCTLQGARRQLLVQTQSQDVEQDTALFFYMLTAAQSIDDYTGNWFDERPLTLGFNANVGAYNPILYLKELPLVALATLTNGNGDIITSSQYTLLPTGTFPKKQVRLNRGNFWRGPVDQSGATNQAFCCGNNMSPLVDVAYAIDAIQIAGLWVFHRNYPRAWRRISQVVDTGGIDDTSTTLNISAQAGSSFDVGSILRVSSVVSGAILTEQMLVTGAIVDSAPSGFATNAPTVERGYNNTTPIDHQAGDPLDVWQPEPMIVSITEQAAAALYKGRDNATGDAQIVADFNARMVIPVDLPVKIKRFLVPYYSWRRGRST